MDIFYILYSDPTILQLQMIKLFTSIQFEICNVSTITYRNVLNKIKIIEWLQMM